MAIREEAVLAGGCFWGVEELVRALDGVKDTEVGYTGGILENPTYEQVKTGQTGHAEAIKIYFDPQKISFQSILEFFFRIHDPTTRHRQGNDVGSQYRSAIFVKDDEQRRVAQGVIDAVNQSSMWKDQVVTEILPLSIFWPAEDHHQDYLQKNPRGYTCHFVRE